MYAAMIRHQPGTRATLLFLLLALLNVSCRKNELSLPYEVSGRIATGSGIGIKGVKLYFTATDFTLTDSLGYWKIDQLTGKHTLTPNNSNHVFEPATLLLNGPATGLGFKAYFVPGEREMQVLHWFNRQQLPNGLLESVEQGNIASLYDNALAAMVFMLSGDFGKAEKIYDFFNARINSELLNGVGGFSQFRDRNGVPGNHRWMGDNAWLLIALNNYKAMTGNTTYDALAAAISGWLVGLQDSDGGLFAGYASDNSRLNYKVTEGNIDAFNAIAGYIDFHSRLLTFLKNDRWDQADRNLVSWPGNPAYLYALDNQSWAYCLFPDYPVSALYTADRFLTQQTATINNQLIHGYDIDEDRDAVFLEGTAQMALAFRMAGLQSQAAYYLNEMEKVLVSSGLYANARGFPYASNRGTGYGDTPLWEGADTKIAISGGAWYLFARFGFNPFAVGRNKNMPPSAMFWLL